MDFANLQAFVTVAEQGSFSQAAAHLFLTQPAISKRIANLEQELGTRLFDRIGRRVDLSEAGQALLPRARQILLAMDDSRRAIHNLAGQVGGRLSMGTSHHIGLHRLPPILRQFSRRWPEVDLDLQFMDSEQVCAAVLHGDLELGVVTLPLTRPAELEQREIWPDPLAIVVARDHPLAKQSRVSRQTLLAHPAILPMQGTFTRELVERALASKPNRAHLQVKLATNYLETIKMMVSIGLGWSVLPEIMLSKELSPLEIPGLKLSRQLGVVWHTGRTLSNAAHEMLTIINQLK